MNKAISGQFGDSVPEDAVVIESLDPGVPHWLASVGKYSFPDHQGRPGHDEHVAFTVPNRVLAFQKQVNYDDAFEELHPRDEGGKFAPKEGGAVGGQVGEVNPHLDTNGDGVTDRSRVGVPGMEVPKTIPRVPGLLHDEWAVEERFATAYERDPAKMVNDYMADVASSQTPNTFSTDDAKRRSSDYVKDKATMAQYNIAVHQTANAIAKAAFVKYLDDVVVKLPVEQQSIMVTAGGVAAGKGYALDNVERTQALAKLAGAVYDTAGEQNSTELPWLLAQAEKRGLRVAFVYIDADPHRTFDRVIERTVTKGRGVDGTLYADSYAIGAKNFKAFHDQNARKSNTAFIYLDNHTVPKQIFEFPSKALVAQQDVFNSVDKIISDKLKAGKLPLHVVKSISAGRRLWAKKG